MAGVLFLFPIIFFCVLFYTRFKTRPEQLYIYLAVTLVIGVLDLCRPGLQRRSVRHRFDRSERAQHLRGGRVRVEPRRCSASCAASPWTSRRATMSRRPRPRGERPVVHHAVGNAAQCARAADRRYLPAHRLHDDPAAARWASSASAWVPKARTGAPRSRTAARRAAAALLSGRASRRRLR